MVEPFAIVVTELTSVFEVSFPGFGGGKVIIGLGHSGVLKLTLGQQEC